MSGDDETYWNSSSSKAFSFDEGEFSCKSNLFDTQRGARGSYDYSNKTSIITDTIFDGIPMINKETVTAPLASLISKHSLSRILDEEPLRPKGPGTSDEEIKILRREIEQQWVPASVSKTVKLIMLGQKYTLHLYQSLDMKMQLLDEAVKVGDGNAILAVVLHLSKTLKKPLFYELLERKSSALGPYIDYLCTRLQVSAAIDLLEKIGHKQEAAIKHLQLACRTMNSVDSKLTALKQSYTNYFLADNSKDKQFVLNFIKYLEWIRVLESSVKIAPNKSALCALAQVCTSHWREPKVNAASPWALQSSVKVSDRQFEWTALTTRAALGQWEDIEVMFITKGWLGRNKLTGVLTMEQLLVQLHKHNAPTTILERFLQLLDGPEKKLEMARKLFCHKIAIDSYVSLKDRQGLVEYKATLNLQSEDYLYAENAIRLAVKWKN